LSAQPSEEEHHEIEHCDFRDRLSVLDVWRGRLRSGADDRRCQLINKCIADNKDEGQARPVLVSYCTCMNNQMSNNEKLSITAWEKTHKKEADACSAKAGWKG